MGRSIRLKCNDCDKSYDLNIGQGRADNSIDRVLGYFNVSTADMIRDKLSVLDSEGSWSYRKMIGYCSSCRSFMEIPAFTIKHNGKEYVTAEKCSCGTLCELFDDNDDTRMNDIKCPDCNGTMTVEHTGMWD